MEERPLRGRPFRIEKRPRGAEVATTTSEGVVGRGGSTKEGSPPLALILDFNLDIVSDNIRYDFHPFPKRRLQNCLASSRSLCSWIWFWTWQRWAYTEQR